MQRVTVVGLGIIGAAWAKNLHDDGLTVRAWNRTPKSVDYFEDDLASAVHDAELIIIVVADPAAVSAVLDVIVPVLKPGQLVAQSSTISADWTLRAAQRVQATGALFLETPFTGSKPAAEARKTVFYLGGDETVVEKARPVLQRLASAILHVGPIGSASSLKLAMNLNIALACEALSEALAFARHTGIPDEKFFDALHLNVARSGFLRSQGGEVPRRRLLAPVFPQAHGQGHAACPGNGRFLRPALRPDPEGPLRKGDGPAVGRRRLHRRGPAFDSRRRGGKNKRDFP